MNILIIYATNSTSTYSVSEIIQEKLITSGHQVTKQLAIDSHPEDLSRYDLILLGSPSWDFEGKEGMPQETMLDFMKRSQGINLNHKNIAIFGCGDSNYTFFCGAVDHLEQFAKDIQGNQICDSLRVDQFYFHLNRNMQQVEAWGEKLVKALDSRLEIRFVS